MRKRGKYEAVPQKASAPSRRRKHRGLLQIYVTSLTTLLMCLSMFLGTTMAWFTDTVSSGGNLIQTGVLNVDVYYNSQSLKKTPGLKVFNDAQWKPGEVVIRTLTIKNEGTLDIMYQLGLQKEAGSDSVASEFYVYYKPLDGPTTVSAASVDLTDGWTKAGTLADVFNGTPVVTGKLSQAQTVHYAVAIQMRGNANADAQGKTIQMAVRLNAYQDNIPNEYIGTVEVKTPEDLASALSGGKKTAMTADITITSNLSMASGATLDGGGRTLTANFSTNSDCAITTTGGTISNLTITGNGANGKTRAIGSGSTGSVRLSQDLVLREVNIDHVQYAINGTGNGKARVTVIDSNIYGWISYANIAQFTFENCHLGTGNSYMGYQVIYGHTNYDHCTFNDFHICADSTVPAKTEIHFTACKYIREDGTTVNVTKDNFVELFMMENDQTDFAKLNVCEIYVDGAKVALPDSVINPGGSQPASQDASGSGVPAASEAASEPVTE